MDVAIGVFFFSKAPFLSGSGHKPLLQVHEKKKKLMKLR